MVYPITKADYIQTMIDKSLLARHARLEIDLDALAFNYKYIKARQSSAELAAVVKADAYGMGVGGVVPKLIRAGCTTFFVATPQEAQKVRALSSAPIIYVFNGFDNPEFMTHHRLRPVINTLEGFRAWQKTGLDYALHVDTGMNRLGISVTDLDDVELDSHCRLLMSHFVESEIVNSPFTSKQLNQFQSVRARYPNIPASLSNSGGSGLARDYAFDVVRAGIALYGGDAGPNVDGLRPVASFKASVLSIRSIEQGDSVGYGASFIAPKPMRVATLGVGYADGLQRAYRGGVKLGDGVAPIIGQISMDLTTIDITHLDVKLGDSAEIFGQNIPVSQLARHCGTIDYEIFTRIGARVDRVYSNADTP